MIMVKSLAANGASLALLWKYPKASANLTIYIVNMQLIVVLYQHSLNYDQFQFNYR